MVQKGKAPYSREAEKSVLGAILMNEENLVTAMQILRLWWTSMKMQNPLTP